ncbi:type IV secretion protein Rhs [Pseudomonas brassicacearum]|uniref:Type IV secretion protein Rhs n=1 Tax=Pseudomonas brassicacearum TaxID=930166 RepID=A0A423H0T0_9PSED|nr:type IV secretion protein Rhs [Pseudomonas brassicacearum]
MQASHDTATPTLSVMDPRGLAIRSVGYCRQRAGQAIDTRITRQIFDAAGRLSESWDPRLWGVASKPNLATVYDLTGQSLLTDSVDGGWQLGLLDETGQLLSSWDSRGSQRHTDYDGLQRPVAIAEQASDEPPRIVERLSYGGSDAGFAEHNQCGQVIRHDDPAGTQVFTEYGLNGLALSESRRVLADLETPNWPLTVDARDALLEETSFVSTQTCNPLGEFQTQTDAKRNVRTFAHTVAGELKAVWLKQAAANEPQLLVSHIRYNAFGQIDSETAGNGVVTNVEYAADNGRLIRLVAGLAQQKPLQDLNYAYDPVGNIVELEDQAQSVSHFNHQRIEPINRYRYDSLYQLVEAKGWEVSSPSHGPALPGVLPTPLDPNQRRTYTQTFDYDRAGNLITRHHSGAASFSMFTSNHSNRSLGERDDGGLPGEDEIARGFDANGNQRELQRGQTMSWDTRNQLSRVALVKRDDGLDDDECYVYDRPGHRLRKVRLTHTGARTLRSEVRYLPGLEIHRDADGEEHHVISVEAGRSSVRVLHWPTSAPEGIDNDQLRYSLSDHLGSSTLELDDQAGVLTQEQYYSFGGTACWAGKSAVVAKYKTIRYSGKERDATGLYYYGYRYYSPWLQRWINPDPAGPVNGLNFFCFVANKPIDIKDVDGRFYQGRDDESERKITSKGGKIIARGLEQFSPEYSNSIMSGLVEVESVYSGALAALNMQLSGSSKILQDYFGPRYSMITDNLMYFWGRGASLANDYQTPLGQSKFVGAVMESESSAHVDPEDVHGRVVLNMKNIQYLPMVHILAHELMHVSQVDEVGNFVLGAVDYFYLNGSAAPAPGVNAVHHADPHQRLSEVIMQGGLTVEYLKGSTSPPEYFIAAVAEASGLIDIPIELDFAVGYFNGDDMLRARVGASNPDNIAYAAKSMNDLLRSKSEGSQLFLSLLNE